MNLMPPSQSAHGKGGRARLELDRAAAERAAFDEAVAQHPERDAPVRPPGWPRRGN
jgi:hypothetical protein